MHHWVEPMRTTLDIDDDVLFAAKDLAREKKVSVGTMLTTLARSGLNEPKVRKGPTPSTAAKLKRFGIVPLPDSGDGVVVTDELVNRIRDEEGI